MNDNWHAQYKKSNKNVQYIYIYIYIYIGKKNIHNNQNLSKFFFKSTNIFKLYQ